MFKSTPSASPAPPAITASCANGWAAGTNVLSGESGHSHCSHGGQQHHANSAVSSRPASPGSYNHISTDVDEICSALWAQLLANSGDRDGPSRAHERPGGSIPAFPPTAPDSPAAESTATDDGLAQLSVAEVESILRESLAELDQAAAPQGIPRIPSPEPARGVWQSMSCFLCNCALRACIELICLPRALVSSGRAERMPA